jgi:hypothetical protein
MKQCRPAWKQFLLRNSFYSVNIFIGNELKCVCVCVCVWVCMHVMHAHMTELVSEERGTTVCMFGVCSCQPFYTLLSLPNWSHIVLYKRAGKNVRFCILLSHLLKGTGRVAVSHLILWLHGNIAQKRCKDKQTLMSERQLWTQVYIAYVESFLFSAQKRTRADSIEPLFHLVPTTVEAFVVMLDVLLYSLFDKVSVLCSQPLYHNFISLRTYSMVFYYVEVLC